MESTSGALTNISHRNGDTPYNSSNLYTAENDILAASIAILTMSAIGVVVNLLAIVVIRLGECIGEKIKIQLINMAVADMLSALSFLFRIAYNMALYGGIQVVNESFCAAFIIFDETVTSASLLCNVAISVERLFIVLYPFKESKYTRTHKYMVVAFIWLVASIFAVANFIGLFVGERYSDQSKCTFLTFPDFDVWFIIGKYAIPCIVIVVSYTILFIKLHRVKSSTEVTSTRRPDIYSKAQRMLVVDAAVTVVTVIPFTLVHSLNAEKFRSGILSVRLWTFCLLAINTFSSPVIYCIFNESFRKDTVNVFKRSCNWK